MLGACSQSTTDANYVPSDSLPNYSQSSFQQYVDETKQWLTEHRIFKSNNLEKELSVNLPFEIKPNKPNGKGVLLVHGLGDSPFSFIDVAQHLADQGYLVRSILLPGHGSKVADLMLPSLEDWQNVVHHHTQLLKAQTDKVWLGGYSTGANLVTSEALKDDNIAGLLLFSPAFKPGSSTVKFAKIASYFVTWADQDPETNPIRYNSLPMHGAAVYYDTVKVVQQDLKGKKYTKPVFMITSEGDHVIDTTFATSVFKNQFTNVKNHLVWQGENTFPANNATTFSMNRPDLKIVDGSHMGLLFSPINPEYGKNGAVRICSNGQTEEQEFACEEGADVWFSAYGVKEKGKIFARLTYNPYFEQSMEMLDHVMSEK
ncbi:alpha/beta fold hydrolase [Aliivibrio sp. A6]|nr:MULTISPECIES: alpha/beta fold hydrolase [Aliivibrio]MDD9178402.1 alpha/beta fold hydrolase [Aliivibrio sp. A6]